MSITSFNSKDARPMLLENRSPREAHVRPTRGPRRAPVILRARVGYTSVYDDDVLSIMAGAQSRAPFPPPPPLPSPYTLLFPPPVCGSWAPSSGAPPRHFGSARRNRAPPHVRQEGFARHDTYYTLSPSRPATRATAGHRTEVFFPAELDAARV